MPAGIPGVHTSMLETKERLNVIRRSKDSAQELICRAGWSAHWSRNPGLEPFASPGLRPPRTRFPAPPSYPQQLPVNNGSSGAPLAGGVGGRWRTRRLRSHR